MQSLCLNNVGNVIKLQKILKKESLSFLREAFFMLVYLIF